MKGEIGTSTYLFSLFPRKLSNKIIPRKLPRKVKVRLKFIQYYQKTENVSKNCRYFGISKNTFYKWYKRYLKEGIEGLYDRPKTPKKKRKQTVRKKYKKEIIEVREKYPTWGKEKIAKYLEVEKGIKVSPSTVYRVLKEANLIDRTRKKKIKNKRKKKGKKNRIKRGLRANRPGEVVQIDVKYILQKGEICYQYTAVDKCTRLSYAKIYSRKSSRKVQTDNGSEFLGEFEK